jgi:hypothetical protein
LSRFGQHALAWTLSASLLASCASAPTTLDVVVVDEDALRSCFGVKVPAELIRDRKFQGGSVLFELYVFPSGKIEYVHIASGSGNEAIDNYMLRRLRSASCSPFPPVDSTERYSVELELEIEVDR